MQRLELRVEFILIASLVHSTRDFAAATLGLPNSPSHHFRSASSFQMSFSHLATVEVQLVMQHCDTAEILLLARTCRHTLIAASNEFAWRGGEKSAVSILMPPVVATMPSQQSNGDTRLRRKEVATAAPIDQFARRSASRLLRHAPINCRWLIERWEDVIGERLLKSPEACRRYEVSAWTCQHNCVDSSLPCLLSSGSICSAYLTLRLLLLSAGGNPSQRCVTLRASP